MEQSPDSGRFTASDSIVDEIKNNRDSATKLQALREPFPDHQISLLPKPTKKDGQVGKCNECGGVHRMPAIHLKYVGHAALTDRLLEVDPYWNWTPLSFDQMGLPQLDKSGGLWIKLTILGVTRLGYGNAQPSDHKEVGAREKELIGDALRNAGMRFGMALDLWHKGDLHGEDAESEVPAPVQPAKKIEPKPKANPVDINTALVEAVENKRLNFAEVPGIIARVLGTPKRSKDMTEAETLKVINYINLMKKE